MVGQDFKVTYFSFLMLINKVVMQYSHNGFLTATQNSVPFEELCGRFLCTEAAPSVAQPGHVRTVPTQSSDLSHIQ